MMKAATVSELGVWAAVAALALLLSSPLPASFSHALSFTELSEMCCGWLGLAVASNCSVTDTEVSETNTSLHFNIL